jgi:WD40 repeat protein
LTARLDKLITHLQQRTLLILDNCESILAGGNHCGDYREGYENYDQLLQRLGQESHQSCVVITGRELPRRLNLADGAESNSQRILSLKGLETSEGNLMLRQMDISTGLDSSLQQLVERYDGNPLALNIVAAIIQQLFGGDVANFLAQAPVLFGNIYELLAQQFQRLSELEKQIMVWLAINREWLSLSQLSEDLWPKVSQRLVMDALLSLQQRSLIEANRGYFTLQPVVMEFVTDQILEQASQEIMSGELLLLNQLALIKAQISDYIRESQMRVILAPLLEQLKTRYTTESLSLKFHQLLQHLQGSGLKGYAAGNLLNLLSYLKLDLTGYDLSSLTIWQAYLRGVNLPQVNLQGANLAHSVFTEKLGVPTGLDFSPDGQLIAVANTDSEIGVWQVLTGIKIHSFTAPGWANFVRFSPNGQYLASTHSDLHIRLWDLSRQTCQQIFRGHTYICRDIIFSPDGQTMFSACFDGVIKQWNIQTGVCLQTFAEHTKAVWALAITPNGDQIVSSSGDHLIKRWDLPTGKCLQTYVGHGDEVMGLICAPSPFNSKESILISTSHDCTIKFWHLDSGECWRTLHGHTHWVMCLSLSPDGQILATAGADHTIKLWSMATGECLRTLQGHQGYIHTLAFNSRDPILASCGFDGRIKLWNVPHLKDLTTPNSSFSTSPYFGQCLQTLSGHTSSVWSVAFSPDNQILASGSSDGLIQLWDANSGHHLQTLAGHAASLWSVDFCPVADLTHPVYQILSTGLDGTLRLWNTKNGTFKTLCRRLFMQYSLQVSIEGKTLVKIRQEDADKLELLDVTTGEVVKCFTTSTSTFLSFSFSRDGTMLAHNSINDTAQLWRVNTEECLQVLSGHSGMVNTMTFHPNGQKLLTGSADSTIKCWDINTGNCLSTLHGHQNQVWSLVFLPTPAKSSHAPLLASASSDGSIKLWDIDTGDCVQTLAGHTSEVRSIAVTPNGKLLASGSLDETIRLWDTQTWECRHILRAPRPYEEMDITNVTGLTEAQKVTLKRLGAVES